MWKMLLLSLLVDQLSFIIYYQKSPDDKGLTGSIGVIASHTEVPLMKNRAKIENNVMGILASVQLTMESVGFKAGAFLFSDSFSLNIIGDLILFGHITYQDKLHVAGTISCVGSSLYDYALF